MFGKAKGQSTLEYVILIGFVVSALIAMGVYMKRGVQGKLRESTDQVGEQYSAYHTHGEYTTESHSDQFDKILDKGATSTEWKEKEKNYQRKYGYEEVGGLDKGDEVRSTQ